MAFSCFKWRSISRFPLIGLFALSVALSTLPTLGQTLDLTITRNGGAGEERPLPVGATPSLTIAVHNKGQRAAGPIRMTVIADGMTLANGRDWRTAAGRIATEIARLDADERVKLDLQLKIERAPLEVAKTVVRVEAVGADGVTAAGELPLTTADCAGAYRDRIAVLRSGMIEQARSAATALSRADAALPGGRLFVTTGVRRGPLAAAERLATSLAARRGGDAQMATEWFRFLILRWTSELNAYAGQFANPGICANNYYQIAGYREGLKPITSRIEAIREAARNALAAAREATTSEANGELLAITRQAIEKAGLDESGDAAEAKSPLALLADARASIGRGRNPGAETVRALSLVETAAWLAETDRRGQILVDAIEKILSTISAAHKKACVCAY